MKALETMIQNMFHKDCAACTDQEVYEALLTYTKEGCEIHNSAKMTLEEVIDVIEKTEAQEKTTVRLHTGDPCIYGAIREQMDILDEKEPLLPDVLLSLPESLQPPCIRVRYRSLHYI